MCCSVNKELLYIIGLWNEALFFFWGGGGGAELDIVLPKAMQNEMMCARAERSSLKIVCMWVSGVSKLEEKKPNYIQIIYKTIPKNI